MNSATDKVDRVAIAQRLKTLYDEISPLIEEFTQEVCPECQSVCCKHRHGRFEPLDEKFIEALGVDIPRATDDRDDDDWCEFLTETGCQKPRWQRPFRCTWYFCEALLQYMPEKSPKRLRKLQRLLQEIQTLRIQLI